MLKKLNKSNKGFTIIEVLIVLAIAALILLIVFLAVPALQRNSRNTQRKNDISGIASAIANYATNNGGSQPAGNGWFSGGGGVDANASVWYCTGAVPNTPTGATWNVGRNVTAATTGCDATNKNFEQAKLGYYKPVDNIMYVASPASAPTFTAVAAGGGTESATNVSINSISINLGWQCNSTGNGLGDKNTRAFALIYVVESGTGPGNIVCQQS